MTTYAFHCNGMHQPECPELDRMRTKVRASIPREFMPPELKELVSYDIMYDMSREMYKECVYALVSDEERCLRLTAFYNNMKMERVYAWLHLPNTNTSVSMYI